MEVSSNLDLWLLVWLLAAAFILFNLWKKRAVGCGLALAYILNLWLIHWPAAALYLLPWYQNFDPSVVEAGFQQSTYAIVAFGAGNVIFAPFLLRVLRFPQTKTVAQRPEPRLATIYMLNGLASFLFLLFFQGLPTITALVSAGWNLLIVGLSLKCWDAWQRRNRKTFLGWLVAAFCLPLFTLITQGFVSFGTTAMVTVLAFTVSFYRPRWKVIVLGLVMGYVGLSGYVTYMRDREDIRAVVWYGQQSYADNLGRVYLTMSTFEYFDLYDTAHLRRVDDRLNQNYLIGQAITHLSSNSVSFAQGETLWQSLIALVPRAIWANKPVFAGSGNLVSKYTGMSFDETTSVGVGQVMEFYINFGSTGVLLGFLVLGGVIAVIDQFAGEGLIKGDWQKFALWFLPGIACLQVGGSLVEVTSSAGAAVVTAHLVNRYLLPRLKGKKIFHVSDRVQMPLSPLRGRQPNPSVSGKHGG